MAEEVVQIEIEQLQPNPLQPRGAITPESLVDLVDSIKEHGILEPLVVAKTPAGYQIVRGVESAAFQPPNPALARLALQR